jgi:Na+/proline symporter
MGFSTVDYIVLLVYLAGITIFGMRFRKTQRSVKDYFVGARQTPWIIICLSIVATETSTLTLIGVPALAYGTSARPEQGGTLTYLQVLIGYIVGRFIIARLFLPSYFRGELLTAYALLEQRFGGATRRTAAALFLVLRALAEGVRVFAASLVLSAVLKSSFPSVPHLWLWSIVIVGVLTLVYTFEGGIAAVIWTDLIQFVIYIGGSLLAAYELAHLIPGGWTGFIESASAAGKLQVCTFLTNATHGTDQLLVQRLLTCRNLRDSQKAIITSGFIVLAQFILFLGIGIMLFSYYQHAPRPAITTNDEIFPAFIVTTLPHGVSGLVIAAIFAAAMSNLSGSLNSLASTTVLDFYNPLTGGRAPDATLLRLSKWCTAGWGVVLIAIAILARGWGSVFTAGLTVASIVYGPMLGAFLLGVLTRRANATGAIAGMTVSAVSMLAIWWTTKLAWTWYVLVGTAICFAVGYVVSVNDRSPT